MADWLSYSLHDFLLFSPDVYWRLLQRHSEDFTIPAIIWALLLVIAFIHIYRDKQTLLVALINGISFSLLGSLFYLQQYATINTFAPYLAYACFVQTFLLVIYVFVKKSSFGCRQNQTQLKCVFNAQYHRWLTLVSLAMIIFLPLVAVLFSINWQAGIVGILPIPTLFFAVISSSFYARTWRFLLLPIPIVLLIIELLTLKVVLDF